MYTLSFVLIKLGRTLASTQASSITSLFPVSNVSSKETTEPSPIVVESTNGVEVLSQVKPLKAIDGAVVLVTTNVKVPTLEP